MHRHLVAIVGSRDYQDEISVRQFVRALAEKYPDAIVISGGARGVDSWATSEATARGLATVEFAVYDERDGRYTHRLRLNDIGYDTLHPTTIRRWEAWCESRDYSSFGRAAFARNTWIVMAAEQVVAFWDGESSGTKNSIDEARRMKRSVHIYQS